MSFGFSVGDVVLLSELAYKLYSTLSSGWKAAIKGLEELRDVLFGLRCALVHLSKVAKDIAVSSASSSDSTAIDMHQKLGLMIQNCGSTLQELERVTSKYIDGVEPMDIKTGSSRMLPLMKFKHKAQVGLTKIRWDMERESLLEYRNKLQAHMDTINIVLNTFLWSTTQRIETNSNLHAFQTQQFMLKSLSSQDYTRSLIEDIQRFLATDAKPNSKKRPAPSASSCPQNNGFSMKVPDEIVDLNRKRQYTGEKEFKDYGFRHRLTEIPIQSTSNLPVNSIPQLCQDLRQIFRPLRSDALKNRDERKKEILHWAQELNYKLDSLYSLQFGTLSRDYGHMKADLQRDFLVLVVLLNELIDNAGVDHQAMFYEASDQEGIYNSLNKLATLSRAVRIQKEVEEFSEQRQEWRMRKRVSQPDQVLVVR